MQNLELKLQQALIENENLRQENYRLKEILKSHNIKFPTSPPDDLKQQAKKAKIMERIQIYKRFFRGRTDVYAVRWETSDGKKGYSPAKKAAGQYLPLTDQVLYNHLLGKQTIGLYPLLQDETCWFLAVDFDKNNWHRDALAFVEMCKALNVPASLERSRSGNGCHIWIFFEQAIPAATARKLGNFLLSRTIENKHDLGMKSFDRFFPNQDTLSKVGLGNLIALPLQGNSRKSGNSVFVNEDFVPYQDQWHYIQQVRKMTLNEVLKIIEDYRQPETEIRPKQEINERPKKLIVIEKNGIYIEKAKLPASFVQKLMGLAVCNNPEFYKAQAKRLSTNRIPRTIKCYEETPYSLILPRGCKEELISLLTEHSIDIEFLNESNHGLEISVDFHGTLRPEQENAVSRLLEHDNGILSATTGFGKTVVAAALIAERKVNTMVIVHRKQLIDQWKQCLSSFLNLEVKQIGQIGGGKNKQTGIIDIATIQSLYYNGEIKELVTQYGQVIVDECHHISAFSFEQVLKAVNAKYIYGLTATPKRKDGLQPIMTMQLGPIRYKVTAKNQAKVRPFEHILVPRYTNFKMKEENKDIQFIFNELIKNDHRNQMIFDDVLKELDQGSVPLLLTERVKHANDLKDKFTGFAKNIILLNGQMSKKEQRENLKRLEELADDEERLVIATGKYIGEGFDHARLDTLFLVMPLSWEGTLQQYVGRLHRLHDDKSRVKVIDYVDHKQPILKAMFEKRRKGYKSMGYKELDNNAKTLPKPEQMKLF
ncbi:DEAD/DEAH box helicase family protein [Bacillus sp. FJAT-29814]|uniref:TOTE conflict system archaeo-eukaryotic primase domain-containing protein n=1 Tax=Bacillus sp. FJAT-29814 TaxID=1729688 RepID=UPI00082E8B21|nr:DEAD/DEAH box helicase [Bacillus sp. FJAT-29814]